MDKRWFLLIILLLAINIVNASIVINGPVGSKLNLGDKVVVDGYILRSNDLIGFFKLNLICEEGDDKILLIRSVSLRNDEKYEFSDSLPLTPGSNGVCHIESSLEELGKEVESSDSKDFEITKELVGVFELENNKIQVGRDVELRGTINKLNGGLIDGIAIIYLKKEGVDFFVDSVNIKDGKFEYIQETTNTPSGIYNIVVEANDAYGNVHAFSNISKLDLVNEIYIFAKAEKETVTPGSTLEIIGEAKTILQEPIENGRIRIYFADIVYDFKLKKSKFSYALLIPEEAKSGKHIINVTIEDDLGNMGSTEADFIVNVIPAVLSVELNKAVFNPGDNIVLRPLLMDQAGDLIKDDVLIEVVDSRGDEIYSINKETNENVEFMLSKIAAPGSWKIKTTASSIKGVTEFSVNEIVGASYKIDNDVIYINNIGNVLFKKTLDIRISGLGKETTVTKKVSLKVNGSTSFDLGKEVEGGTYDISVDGKTYKDISISGESKRSYTLFWWIVEGLIIGGVVAFLVYMFIRKRNLIFSKMKEKIKIKKLSKGMPGHGPNVEIKEKVLSPEEKKQKNIKEFRDMLLKSIEKREREIEDRNFEKEGEKKDDGNL